MLFLLGHLLLVGFDFLGLFAMFLLFVQEILATLHFDVLLSGLWCWWERVVGIFLFLFVFLAALLATCSSSRSRSSVVCWGFIVDFPLILIDRLGTDGICVIAVGFLLFGSGFLELREKSRPIGVLEVGISHQFSLDHELLDVENGMDIFLHAFSDDLVGLLETKNGPDHACGLSCQKDMAFSEKFECLQSGSIRSSQAISTFDESFSADCIVVNLDEFTKDVVFQDFCRLRNLDTPCDQFQHVSCLDDDVRVPRLFCRLEENIAIDKIEFSFEKMVSNEFVDGRPNLFQIFLSPFGEPDLKRGLFHQS